MLKEEVFSYFFLINTFESIVVTNLGRNNILNIYNFVVPAPTTNLAQMSQSSGYLLANISHFLKLWCNICSFEATSALTLETHYK